jgi:hypothetical protein
MFGVDGALSFEAEAAGASQVTCVDIEVTEAFEQIHHSRASSVRMVVGDVLEDRTVSSIEPAEVVFCLGVFYHVPDPARLVAVLAQLCTDKLFFEGLTSPEVTGVKQAAVYLPQLRPHDRLRYNTDFSGRLAGGFAIKRDFEPEVGYSNNFWAMTPSCVVALLESGGFEVEEVLPSPSGLLRHLFIARRTSVGSSQ